MLSGGTRYKCFIAWRDEARNERESRDSALRAQLLKKGNLLGVRVVKAWFEWRAERLKAKYKVVWKISHAGYAFRAWLSLIDAKRRREFLEWALGPDMVLIANKLKAAVSEDRAAARAPSTLIITSPQHHHLKPHLTCVCCLFVVCVCLITDGGDLRGPRSKGRVGQGVD